MTAAKVQVRYIVHDVDAAIAFYCRHLGFHEDMHPSPMFAMLSRGDLRLVLSARAEPLAAVSQCLMARHNVPAGGIGSRLRSLISSQS